jgi:hypothetical protein
LLASDIVITLWAISTEIKLNAYIPLLTETVEVASSTVYVILVSGEPDIMVAVSEGIEN